MATSGSRRSTRSRASSRAASPITDSSLAASPAGSITSSTAQPSARSPSATPAPNAAQAPGSETRIARRASRRCRASLTAVTAIRSPRTTSPMRVEALSSMVDDGTPAATSRSTASITPDSSATPLTRAAAA